jgi:hypothetical protein
MIVERAGGTSYRDYCREHLFAPAGMTSTGFCRDAGFDERRLAHGYQEGQDVGPASAHSYGWEYRGMGGIVTSVADVERWGRALREGRVLRSSEKLKMGGPTGYAAGGWAERTSRGTTQITLGGNVAGFNSMIWLFPDDRAQVAVLCNTPGNALVVGLHSCRRLFGHGGMVTPPPKKFALDAAALAAMCGTYRSDDGAVVRLRAAGNAVDVSAEGQAAVHMLMSADPAVPPFLQPMIDEARSLLDEAIAGGDARFRAIMNDTLPVDWPARFREYWQSIVGPRGAIEPVELLGARPTAMAPSSLKAVFRLHQAGGETTAEIVLVAGMLQSFWLDAPGPLIEKRYVATSPTTLESYQMGPGASPVVEVDVENGDLVLRGTGGSEIAFARVDAEVDRRLDEAMASYERDVDRMEERPTPEQRAMIADDALDGIDLGALSLAEIERLLDGSEGARARGRWSRRCSITRRWRSPCATTSSGRASWCSAGTSTRRRCAAWSRG